MAGNTSSSLSKPQPERAKIVTPLVQNSIIVQELDQVQPVVARLDEPKLSRLVIQPRPVVARLDVPQLSQLVPQPRVQHRVPVNRPATPQGRLVDQRPVSAGQSRLPVTPPPHGIVVEPSVTPPVVQVQRSPAAQQSQATPVAKPPLIIAPAAANVRPTNYLYIPGLAQDQYVQSPCADLQSFCARVRAAFGYRIKTVSGGRNSVNRCVNDVFMTGSVDSLCNGKGVTAINCGRAFRWVMITTTEMDVYTSESTGMRYFDGDRKMYSSKAFRQLGAPQDNYMALTPGKKNPARELAYDVQDTPHCIGSEYMALRRAAGPDDQNQPARFELLPLEHLRDDDMLYIVGHGNQRGGRLTYKVPVPSYHVVDDRRAAGRLSGYRSAL